MPAPSAVINVPIISDDSIRSTRTRSTLRILPRSGRIAWFWRERPPLAEPPAESPSTMKISDFAGSFSWQSASLPGSVDDAHDILANGLARLARRLARRGRLDHLGDDDLAFGRMLFQPGAERLVDQAFHDRPHFRRDQLVLGLRGKFRIRNLDRQHRRQPFAAIVAGQRHLFLLGNARWFRHSRSSGWSARRENRQDACRRRAAGCCW